MKRYGYEDWSLNEALIFVRALEKHLDEAGFHVAIGGSVLQVGYSRNDLDLVVFPHDASKVDIRRCYKALEEAGCSRVCARSTVAKEWESQKSTDTKHVEVWTYQDRRVDLFFLR